MSLWKKIFGRSPQSEKWRLTCPLCGRVYDLGSNAHMTTVEEFFSMTGIHLPDNPDVVGPLREDFRGDREELRSREQAKIKLVCRALARGERRTWKCNPCNNKETPHEYPSYWKFAGPSDFDTAAEMLVQPPPRITIDLRSEREKEIAEAGARGVSLEPETDELMSLLAAAHDWGRVNGWPLVKKYPQYHEIRSIGESINSRGGMEAMQRTFYYVKARDKTPSRDIATLLTMFWNGIGDWESPF